MVGREVQRIEIELLAFHLGAFGQLPAHRHEGIRDVLSQDRDRVPRSDCVTGRRKRDIDGLGHQNFLIAPGAQDSQPFIEKGLRLGPGQVDPLAGLGTVAFGQRGQRLPGQGQRSAIAEVLGFGAGKGIEIACRSETLASRGHGGSQRVWGQSLSGPRVLGRRGRETLDGLLTHAARLSLAGEDFAARV